MRLSLASALVTMGGCVVCDDPYAIAWGEPLELVLVPDADGIYPRFGGRMEILSTSSRADIYTYGVDLTVDPLDPSVGDSTFAILDAQGDGTARRNVTWLSGTSLVDEELTGGVAKRCHEDCRRFIEFEGEVATDYGEPIRIRATPWVYHLDCDPVVEATFDLELQEL